ncbi:MAG: protein phosphatase [Microlunatus sp.]|nr:protein phosphatase [Microlunatus sp.]MDN5804653.1 protein phosphatase [Microlunatus sp.]
MGSWSKGTSGLVILPDGRRVRGRGLRYGRPAEDLRPELGVYLSAQSPAPEAWESVWVCWADFALPRHRAEAVDALRYVHGEAATRRVEIACRGGVGRTGTAIALLARLAGVPGSEAVAWSRTHYRAGAVETPWQRRFVAGVDLDR